jgi:site-specific DNA-methyltransferase (adenine-specific)
MSFRKETLAEGVDLYCGDAIELLDHAAGCDLVITDPPYSSGARTDSERQVRGSMLRGLEDEDWFSSDSMTTWGFNWFIRSAFSQLRLTLPQGAHVYVFIDWRQTPNVYGMLEATGFRVNHCLVWAKSHFGMGTYWRNQHENIVFASNGKPTDMLDRGMGSVLTFPGVHHESREHPTEKPAQLLAAIIEAVPGKRVLDPFMGSGSSGVAAIQCGRQFTGFEINPAHFDTACRRIEKAARTPRLFTDARAPIEQTSMFSDEAA